MKMWKIYLTVLTALQLGISAKLFVLEEIYHLKNTELEYELLNWSMFLGIFSLIVVLRGYVVRKSKKDREKVGT